MRIIVLHGPNLNLLGTREPEIYGSATLEQINESLRAIARELGVELDCFQSNHEGELVERIQAERGGADCIIINPAAYTHTSVAIHDALMAAEVPVIEVHLSNIYARERFRHKSLVSPVARAVISGLGPDGYEWALRAAVRLLESGGQ